MIRLVFMMRRRSSLPLPEFHRHWCDRHAPMLASCQTSLRLLRHTQSRNIDHPGADAMRSARGGMRPPFDGVAETWWESEEDLRVALATVAGQEALNALVDSQREFVDPAASALWFAHEYPHINPSPETIVARDYSGVVKAYYPLIPLAALGVAGAQRYWLAQHGPLIRRINPAIGLLRYQQVHRFKTDLTRLFQQAYGVPDSGYIGHAEAWIDLGILRSGEDADAANLLAIEDEQRFIDFDRSSTWLGKEKIVVDAM